MEVLELHMRNNCIAKQNWRSVEECRRREDHFYVPKCSVKKEEIVWEIVHAEIQFELRT